MDSETIKLSDIKKLRLERHWSQEQLAEMSGLSTRTIQRIERGATPSTETLKCIAAVLEVDFQTLQETPDMHSQSQAEQDALDYVRDIKSFYTHLFTFAVINAGLLIINLVMTPGYLWVIWSVLGWGIGIVSHGLSVFEVFNLFSPEWERRQAEKRLHQNR